MEAGEEEECIICREKAKRDRPIGYLVEMVKKTLSSVFYREENKTDTMMKSCFHCVHADCYVKSVKSNRKCPLCSKTVNGIIPMHYEQHQKKFIRICFTIISSAMLELYDVLDIHRDRKSVV